MSGGKRGGASQKPETRLSVGFFGIRSR